MRCLSKIILALLGLLMLCPALCEAKQTYYPEDINDMFGKKTLVVTGENKVGTTDFVTYTCGGGAQFVAYGPVPSKICISVPKSGDYVQTSLIPDLKKLEFNYYPDGYNYSSTIKVYVSTDGSAWSELSPSTSRNNYIAVDMPEVGDYYVKIQNTNNSNSFYLYLMAYTTEVCYCLKIVE